MKKIIFNTNYSPHKLGDKVELENKLANHYLSLGVARECGCGSKKAKPCSDCEKKSKVVAEVKTEKKVKAPKNK